MSDSDIGVISSASYCLIVNDKNNKLLGEIVDHLGLLESGRLKPMQKQIGSKTIPCYILPLDTKYYTCDVTVLGYEDGLDDFLFDVTKQEKTKDFEISACLFCASREELSENFLSKLSKFIANLSKVEVKALVLRDTLNQIEEPSPMGSCDEFLNKFVFSNCTEIIELSESANKRNFSADENGKTGIPRVVELIETVQWPNLKRKPNPIGSKEHIIRLKKYIESEEVDRNDRLDSCLQSEAGSGLISSSLDQSQKNSHDLVKPASMDYPDSEDEEAILEWFDRPFNQDIINSPSDLTQIRAPWTAGTINLQNFDDHKIAFILGNLNEAVVQGSSVQYQAPIQRTR